LVIPRILTTYTEAVHKVGHAILIVTPYPVTHCHTSRDPLKYVTHLGTTPQFLVVHAYIHMFYRGFVLVHEGF